MCILLKGDIMTIIARNLEGYSADVWANLPWRLFERRLVRLQRRIHKATKIKNKKLVTKLQRLLIGSNSARYLSVRYAIDSITAFRQVGEASLKPLTSKQKIKLVHELKYPSIINYKDSDWGAFGPYDVFNLKITSLQCLNRFMVEPVSEIPSSSYFYRGQLIVSPMYLKTGFRIPLLDIDSLSGLEFGSFCPKSNSQSITNRASLSLKRVDFYNWHSQALFNFSLALQVTLKTHERIFKKYIRKITKRSQLSTKDRLRKIKFSSLRELLSPMGYVTL
uniref:Reverse transcriptase n=1 Tax=Chroomonas mesostigmatica CCMP1168 TaxID=1195612 RepID=A0A248SPL1_9CRYP|nr:reverse transcriptase [Chroomonas mesostigmatica CCMP1168]